MAAIDGNRRLTYEELEASYEPTLRSAAPPRSSRHDRVGLYLDKSLESVIGVYGILKTGAAYVPLDPQAPVSRLAHIARDCDLKLLVTGIEKARSVA